MRAPIVSVQQDEAASSWIEVDEIVKGKQQQWLSQLGPPLCSLACWPRLFEAGMSRRPSLPMHHTVTSFRYVAVDAEVAPPLSVGCMHVLRLCLWPRERMHGFPRNRPPCETRSRTGRLASIPCLLPPTIRLTSLPILMRNDFSHNVRAHPDQRPRCHGACC